VVFSSDHGDHDAARKMEHKTVPYDEAARVPLLISHAGVTKAGHVDRTHLVSNGLDLIPTLCDYAGIDSPEGLLGGSLRPLAEGKAPANWREDLLCESQIARMVRTGRHKYIAYDDGDNREQLFDLQADPHEKTNLAASAAHAATLRDHRKRLAAWMERTGDRFAKKYRVAST